MDFEMKDIITKAISEYWKPYEELEIKVKEILMEKGMQVDSVFIAGDINNMYVYVQANDNLYVFNENSDVSNALLLKEYGIR